jgi:hypothetical protein
MTSRIDPKMSTKSLILLTQLRASFVAEQWLSLTAQGWVRYHLKTSPFAARARRDFPRHCCPLSIRSIATQLERSPSTISCEINRNGGYDHYRVQCQRADAEGRLHQLMRKGDIDDRTAERQSGSRYAGD